MTVKHTLVSLDMRVFALCSLMELHRHEKAGTCPQSLYPVCTGTRRHHVWHGIDDRPVFHCTGDRIDHHGTVGNGRRGCDRASGRDRGKDRSGRDAGIHPLVDRDAAGKPFDHSAVFYHDPYGIWKDVQAVYVYCHCAHPHFHLCGRTLPVGGEELHQVLCRGVSGRGDHCTGLYHFLCLFCQSASHWGYVLKCSDHCVELCRGIGVQPAGAGGCGESI